MTLLKSNDALCEEQTQTQTVKASQGTFISSALFSTDCVEAASQEDISVNVVKFFNYETKLYSSSAVVQFCESNLNELFDSFMNWFLSSVHWS